MSPLPALGLDTADFGILRRNGQVYVDKTAYIQRMLEARMRYVFLARPRRFGKSLLVSTLAHLFGRETDDLFQGLDIAISGYLADMPRVPVLVLNMARVEGDTPSEIRDELTRLVGHLALPFGVETSTQAPPWGALDSLFAHLRRQYGTFAVLVDEYDAPLASLLAKPTFSIQAQQEAQGHLRAFYRTLKNWDEAMQFVFVTGILRVEGAGLFSALNNLRNLSDRAPWSGLCGFTEAEVERYLGAHLEVAAAHLPDATPDTLRAGLRRHYNGYRFAATGEPVYNPISYLTALDYLTDPQEASDMQVASWPRPWLDLGKTMFLYQYMEREGLALNDVDFDPSHAQSTFDLARPAFSALLYQTGFLTLARHEDGRMLLDYPNWEVESAFKEGMFFAYFGQPMGKDSPLRKWVREVGQRLLAHDCRGALAAFDRILDRVTYVELTAETHYQLALHLVCELCQSDLRVDAEVTGRRGRSDIVVETRDTIYVFELKLNASVEDALAQMAARGYLAKYATENKRTVGVGVNFVYIPSRRGGHGLPSRRGGHGHTGKPSYAWNVRLGPGTEFLFDSEKPASLERTRDNASPLSS